MITKTSEDVASLPFGVTPIESAELNIDLLTQTRCRRQEVNLKTVSELKVKIFADGADKAGMQEMYAKPYIKGFTTNPTLMRKAGIQNYVAFAQEILRTIPDRPISFEVFSDEFPEMEAQAKVIAGWGKNVYVKIPVTNTRGEVSFELVHRLSHNNVQVNVTAIMTLEQVHEVAAALSGGAPSCVSVFAGRIADTGRDPVPLMVESLSLLKASPKAELIWASPRELLNIFQADEIGCHIITVTNDILKKLDGTGKDLGLFSLETVKMFRNDALAAGYQIDVKR
jgi:transaldolase